MFPRTLMAVMVLGLPNVIRAQGAPEQVLPRDSQIYLRWDGVAAHRKVFDQSAVGKMLRGDMGTFLSALVSYVEKQVDGVVGQAEPQAAGGIQALSQFLRGVGQNGFRLGIEVRKLDPPEVAGMLVFPKAARGEGALSPLLRKAAGLAGAQIKESKKANRTVFHIDVEPLHLGWWNEGDDAVLVIGTRSPDNLLPPGAGQDFTTNSFYRELKSFKEFPTWADGFLDLGSLLKVASGWSPEVSRLIDDLGLKGLKSITFHSGFEGPAERSVVIFDLPGPRKGLLQVANQRKIKLADLPPMPADLTSFTASNLNLASLYDAVLQAAETAVRIFAPNQLDPVKEGIKMVESTIGVKLREELFASLDDLVVQYNSPADGPLGLGSVLLVKVKDAQKLQKALDKIMQVAATIPFIEFSVKKRTYRSVEIHELHLGGEGNFQLPAYAIHNNWLAFSSYPQPIQGFVLRAGGELPAWKVSKSLDKRLQAFPGEFVGIAVSDPRPGMRFLLSLAPPLVALGNGLVERLAPGARFDVGLIPNAHEVTRHLFPNITVTTDDGKKVRIESRASLAWPF